MIRIPLFLLLFMGGVALFGPLVLIGLSAWIILGLFLKFHKWNKRYGR